MKTTLILLTIFVTAHGKTIRLTPVQVDTLSKRGTWCVKETLAKFKQGGSIRNNEVADQIFSILNK